MLIVPPQAGIQPFMGGKPNYLAENVDFPRPAVLSFPC